MSEGGDLPGLPAKELSKVGNNLINKVSKAIGQAYQPVHVVLMAKAEAKAKVIHAKADIEVSDLQRRAEQRRLNEELRHQENIEAVIRKAISDLRPDAKPEAMNEDLVWLLFDHAKKVSDEELQSLWAKILAGEANAPGTFNKRALQTVALLEKEDAELFTALCRFAVYVGEPRPLIFNVDQDSPYVKEGINFGTLTHLEAVGLLRFDGFSGFAGEGFPREFVVGYGDERYKVTLPEGQHTLSLGKVLLTNVGRALLTLCNAPTLPGFANYVMDHWKSQNGATATQLKEEQPPQAPTETAGP